MTKQIIRKNSRKWLIYTFFASAAIAVLVFSPFDNFETIWLTVFVLLACIVVVVGVHYYSKLIQNESPLGQSKLGLKKGEEVLIEGEASMIQNGGVQTGVLFLTSNKIVFYKESSLPLIIELSEMVETRICSNKKLLSSRMLSIQSSHRPEYNFFIDYPEDWQSLIQKQMLVHQEGAQLSKTGSE